MRRRRREADALDLHALEVVALGAGHAEVLVGHDRRRAVVGAAFGALESRGLEGAFSTGDADLVGRRGAGGEEEQERHDSVG